MGRKGWGCLGAMGVALMATLACVQAQTCDDFDACTSNDMCAEGNCMGTPLSSGSCDDGNECTINDRCGLEGLCLGDPAPRDTPCGNGCGKCQPIVDGAPGVPLTCKGDPVDNGKVCDPGLGFCFVGTCLAQTAFAFCQPVPRLCPDTDGNPCTDNCNAETARCERDAPKCNPVCETCNPSTGGCEPANIGTACDDFNPCSPQSRCEIFSPGAAGLFEPRGLCMPGAPNEQTPTRTATPLGVTPTATAPASTATATAPLATSTATATITHTPLVPATSTATRTVGTPPVRGHCPGDCDENDRVAINELVTGVAIALGNAPISACPSFDINASNTVEVNELILGVNNLLGGCPS